MTVKKKKIRQKKIKYRKNFFPTLIVIMSLWTLLAGFVYFVEPEAQGAVPLFLALVFLTLILTFSTLFINTRRGTITALGITFFLILRYFGVGNILNFLLLFGVAVATEIFFSKTES